MTPFISEPQSFPVGEVVDVQPSRRDNVRERFSSLLEQVLILLPYPRVSLRPPREACVNGRWQLGEPFGQSPRDAELGVQFQDAEECFDPIPWIGVSQPHDLI
jgi:hypothetical protein